MLVGGSKAIVEFCCWIMVLLFYILLIIMVHFFTPATAIPHLPTNHLYSPNRGLYFIVNHQRMGTGLRYWIRVQMYCELYWNA